MKDSISSKEIEDLNALIVRFVRKMKLPSEVSQEAHRILEQAQKLGVSTDQNPRGQAAAAVYIASIFTNNRVTQNQIAHVFEVSVQTIRTRYVKLVKTLGIRKQSK